MSPITPKTNLTTPMLPLHAIPTEVIRKGFRPYRGFMTHLEVDLPASEIPVRRAIDMTAGPLTGDKIAELAINLDPIFKVFADQFGYNLDLLKVGNGDCGVDGHDWNLYGRKERVPLVIRWRGFDGGEALFCIGSERFSPTILLVSALANEQMVPQVLKVFESLGVTPAVNTLSEEDVHAGDLLEKVVTVQQWGEYFKASLYGYRQGEEVTPTVREDFGKVRFSCNQHLIRDIEHLFYGSGSPITKPVEKRLRQKLQPGARLLVLNKKPRTVFDFREGEPLPATMLQAIYDNSVEDIEGLMQQLLAPDFTRYEERVQRYLIEEELAFTVGNPEETERLRTLQYFMLTMEEYLSRYNEGIKLSFSRDFRTTPPKTLLGTGSQQALDEGHVRPSSDAIFELMKNVADYANNTFRCQARPRQLLGRVIISPELELQLRQRAMSADIRKLDKAYTTLYRGLPVRVTETTIVTIGEDEEALACDFYLDPTNRQVHFVALYRVKAPKTE